MEGPCRKRPRFFSLRPRFDTVKLTGRKRPGCVAFHSIRGKASLRRRIWEPDAPPQEIMSPAGFRLLPGKLGREAQVSLVREVLAAAETAPFYRPLTPGGKPMSVEMTGLGPLCWVTDARGYRYEPVHPVTGMAWPAIPGVPLDLWAELCDPSTPPDACLVNLYRDGAKMGCTRTATRPTSAFRCCRCRWATRPSSASAGRSGAIPRLRCGWPLATSACWRERRGSPSTASTA